jgi:tetratricopeptide repeat protein 21B
LLGALKDKESGQDAAEAACVYYQEAWKLEFEASATTGFKLASCLLRSRRCVEAVDVCERVLEQYPDYPRIQEEILKKAHLLMRDRGERKNNE